VTTDASNSQGVQAGDHNVQHNHFASKAPLDPVALSHLNPHFAVSRLQQLSHDELVDFFAAAPADAVPEILVAFLEADEAAVVAVLGDINRRKATELIRSLRVSLLWREELPKASEAIARKAAALKWAPVGGLRAEGGGSDNRQPGLAEPWRPGFRGVSGWRRRRPHSVLRARCTDAAGPQARSLGTPVANQGAGLPDGRTV
jgi:hypothetical protein